MHEYDVSEETGLSRRELLTKGGAVVVGGLGLGGILWGRRTYAVDSLEQEMLAKTAPITTATAHDEMLALPPKAREEIRLFFDGVCLDVHSFVSEVCSQGFVERLGACPSNIQRHQLMALEFEQHVVTTDEILNRVRVIAEEVGTELDRNWARCCTQIAQAWGVPLRMYDAALSGDRLAASVEPEIREQIDQVIQRTMTAVRRPAFGDVPVKIGESALLLLPLAVFAPPHVVLPIFVGVALKHIIDPMIAWLVQSDPRDVQRDVSARMALLGNRAGAEFEREVRRRIADLHNWREAALQKVARTKAETSVQWL
jgi:hypothetical protein